MVMCSELVNEFIDMYGYNFSPDVKVSLVLHLARGTCSLLMTSTCPLLRCMELSHLLNY